MSGLLFIIRITVVCVLRVKVPGARELLTVVGQAVAVTAGEFSEAAGTWKNDPQYGRQLAAFSLKVTAPTNIDGRQKYLASGLIKGLGPV